MGLTTNVMQPVAIVKGKYWEVAKKCEIVLVFFTLVSFYSKYLFFRL